MITKMKEQAASITKQKVQQLQSLIPGLINQFDMRRGKTRASKDDVVYIFKNTSQLNILTASEKARGQRRTAGLMEEVILIEPDILNEVIIPTMNVDRRLADGTRDPKELANKRQIYVTTAGFRATFAYEKLKQILIESVIKPDKSFIAGGSWRIPVMQGLLSKNFVNQLKLDGTFNEASFAREYGSEWGGDGQNAYFSAEQFDRNRVVQQPEYEFSKMSNANTEGRMFYIIGVDVGRRGCNTEAMVIKCVPQSNGVCMKTLVNLFPISDEHFETQAIFLKKLCMQFQARTMAIDGNGLGIGLVDYLIKPQTDPETGDVIPAFGVENLDEYPEYKPYRPDNEYNSIMYIIKANAPLNTEAYGYLQSNLGSNKLKLLIDERIAKNKLLSTKKGMDMSPEQRAEYLKPYTYTTVLREQMLNLSEENEGVNIILKQSSKNVPKDKFSALLYGMYYIHKYQMEYKQKKKGRFGQMIFFSNS